MNLEDRWLIEKEIVLAWMRFAFSIIAIAVIHVIPESRPWFPALSYGSVYGFSVSFAVTHPRLQARDGLPSLGTFFLFL